MKCLQECKLTPISKQDVNKLGGKHGSALHAASSRGDEAAASLLLDHGANINARHDSKGTALSLASKRNRDGLALLLLEKGAVDYDGEALIAALSFRSHIPNNLDRPLVGRLLEANRGTDGLDKALSAVEQWQSKVVSKLRSPSGQQRYPSSRQKALLVHCEQAAATIRAASKQSNVEVDRISANASEE